MTKKKINLRTAGFTLVELLVVVLIIGILAAIAVPQYFKVVEKGRVAEATSCFETLNGAQERYFLKNNTYSNSLTNLDTNCAQLKYFSTAAPTAGASSWNATLTRNITISGYGQYVITYTAGNGQAITYTCNNTSCVNDLLP